VEGRAVALDAEGVAVDIDAQLGAVRPDGERRGPHDVAQGDGRTSGRLAGDRAPGRLQRQHAGQYGPSGDVVVGDEELLAGEVPSVGGT
jgi:hypothetical protein